MKRLLVALAAGAAASTLAFASASSLPVNGGAIQAGQDGVTCDSDGVKVNWGLETDDNSVRSVSIDGISDACEGATLFVKVNNGATKKTTIDSNKESFSFSSPYPTAQSIHDVKVWIEG